MMTTILRNVMVDFGPTSEVVDLLVDERGLTLGAHGQFVWLGSEVSTEAGPSWCTIRVVPPTALEVFFFVPSDTFEGQFSPRAFATWLEAQARAAGAKIRPMPASIPA